MTRRRAGHPEPPSCRRARGKRGRIPSRTADLGTRPLSLGQPLVSLVLSAPVAGAVGVFVVVAVVGVHVDVGLVPAKTGAVAVVQAVLAGFGSALEVAHDRCSCG